MTGREVLAATKPLEAFATAVSRFAALGHDAVRLEESLASGTRRLSEVSGNLSVAQGELARLQAESEALVVTLATERTAAEQETAARCAARVTEAEAAVADRKRATEIWTAKEREARVQHDATMTRLAAEESDLRTQIEDLKGLARRMAQAAGAVLR